MPDDDPFADEGPFGPPLPPDDRLWRHPSELAWTPLQPSGPLARAPRVWGIALTSGLAGAVLALGVVALVGGLGDQVDERVIERVPVERGPDLFAPKAQVGIPEVAAVVSPSVVRLDVTTDLGAVVGSGVVMRDDGTVLTNAHVVEGAVTVTVVLQDGTGLPGRVAGADRLTDVAVVVVDDPGGDVRSWVPALFGSADGLEVGELAIAIGSPLGLAGGPSVTAGVVSGLGRRVAAEGLTLHGLIQTDAPIASGSSGGALCDGDGVVVGITTALSPTEAGADGLGFAIPADVARAVAEELLGHGTVRHAWLGIEGADLAPTEASVPGMTGSGGVRVVGVDPIGPAAAAGVLPDDVVVAFAGTRLTSMSDLVADLRTREPGEVVSVELRRDGEVVVVEVTLAERP